MDANALAWSPFLPGPRRHGAAFPTWLLPLSLSNPAEGGAPEAWGAPEAFGAVAFPPRGLITHGRRKQPLRRHSLCERGALQPRAAGPGRAVPGQGRRRRLSPQTLGVITDRAPPLLRPVRLHTRRAVRRPPPPTRRFPRPWSGGQQRREEAAPGAGMQCGAGRRAGAAARGRARRAAGRPRSP